MPKSTGDAWMGTTGAAKYLGVYPRTVYKLIDRGALPAYQIGRVIRIKRQDLDAFLEASRIEPGSLAHLYPAEDADDP
ncbi:MAG: helix-turn-helix domain-containing protein [Actinomycetota bacterium]|nr:helix-turn-helix domain-containing protein [Actinomycetota bacterium]